MIGKRLRKWLELNELKDVKLESGSGGKSAERDNETYQGRDIEAVLVYFVLFQ